MIKFENALITLNGKEIKVQLCRNVAYLLYTKDIAEEVSFTKLAELLRGVEVLKHSRNFWKVLQTKMQ